MYVSILLVSQQGMKESVNEVTLANWDVEREEGFQKTGYFMFSLLRHSMDFLPAQLKAFGKAGNKSS